MTELLYLRDAELREFDAVVAAVDADGGRVALDRTAFYPTGGGQPHDTGTLGSAVVTNVRRARQENGGTTCGTPSTVRSPGWGSRSTASSTGIAATV